MSLFVFVMVILSTQDPYLFSIKPEKIDVANMQAFEIIDYELNSTNTKASYEAKKWVKYQDKDILDDFRIYSTDFNLSAKLLVKDEIKSILEGNVSYVDINKTTFFTQKAVYNIADKNLYGNENFEAYVGDNKIIGDGFFYDIKKKELKVQGIKAWLLE